MVSPNDTEPSAGQRHQRTHIYEVRPSIGGPPVLTSVVNRQAGTITVRAASGDGMTLDVVTARAVWITIREAVYEQRSLHSNGPAITLRCDWGNGRQVTVRRDG